MEKKVSIILPYYNRKELIIKTLKSFEYFYHDRNLEVVIVDDVSSEKHRLEDIVSDFNLNIKLVRLEDKTGINPCYPYNVGVRESSGDIIVLSSPETFHTTNMYYITNDFKELTNDTYLLMSVFCLTNLDIVRQIFSDFNEQIKDISKIKELFYVNLGENGYSFNNRFGSWYSHSQIKPSSLNFFTALTRDKFYDLSGFDERFRFGTGYDDDDFRDRLNETNTRFINYDDAIAIHINHEVVNNAAPTTNQALYNHTKTNKYLKNDTWGRH